MPGKTQTNNDQGQEQLKGKELLKSAIYKGAAQRAERVVAGSGSASATRYGTLPEMLEVGGVAAATNYWNKSRTDPGAWMFGELVLAPLIGLSQSTSNSFTRISTGVFAGALMSLLGGGSTSALAISAARPLKKVTDW